MNTKKITVIEREYDSAGNLVKETETITEYGDFNGTSWPAPYSPYVDPYQPLKVTY